MVWLLFRANEQDEWSFCHNAATVSEFYCLVGSDTTKSSQITALHTRVASLRSGSVSTDTPPSDGQVLILIPVHGATHPDDVRILRSPPPTPSSSCSSSSSPSSSAANHNNNNFLCEVLQRSRTCFPDTIRMKHAPKLGSTPRTSDSTDGSVSSNSDEDEDDDDAEDRAKVRAVWTALRDRVNASVLMDTLETPTVRSVSDMLSIQSTRFHSHSHTDKQDGYETEIVRLDNIAAAHLRATGAQVVIVARYMLNAIPSSSAHEGAVTTGGCLGLAWQSPLLTSHDDGDANMEGDDDAQEAGRSASAKGQQHVLVVPISRHAEGNTLNDKDIKFVDSDKSIVASLDGVDEDVLVALGRMDHRMYSMNTERLEGPGGAGKTPSEMLDDMKRRHASGSFVEIVPPLTTLADLFRISTATGTSAETLRAKTSSLERALGFRSAATKREQKRKRNRRTIRFRRQVGTYPVNTDIFLTLKSS